MKFNKWLSLALKWRPKNLNNLVGQNHIIRFLKLSIKFNEMRQSYLFFGPSGTGKTSLARILAKYLNCMNKKFYNCCNKCNNCKLINSNNFPDYIEIDGAHNRSVDEISILLENIIYLPVFGLYKIYVIDEFHMLSNHAFSIMLKLLEEPPLHVKFILITTDFNKLPITIISRCICLNFKSINIYNISFFIFKILVKEKIFFSRNSLFLISRLSKGNLRDALSITDQIIYYSNRNIKTKFLFRMLNIIDQYLLIKLIFYIYNVNIDKILKLSAIFKKNNISYLNIVFDIINIFYELIIIQFTNNLNYILYKNKKAFLYLAKLISPNKIQLYYQNLLSNIINLKIINNYNTFIMIIIKLTIVN